MTIKNANPFFKKKCPQAFAVCPIEDFRGKAISIDAGDRFFKIGSGVNKTLLSKLKNPTDIINRLDFMRQMKHDVLVFQFSMMRRGILTVWCFDGKKHELKSDTIKKRIESSNKTRQKAQDFMEQRENMNPLDVTDDVDKQVMKARANDYYITHAEQNEIKEMLKSMGIPCFTAEYEAEKLCASLCIEELVFAVMSVDSDGFPLGTPLRILSHDFSKDTFEVVILQEIIETFCELFECDEESSFLIMRDLCIMFGCDFNTNIPKIGEVNSFKLMMKYKDIEMIMETTPNSECLNYQECVSDEFFGYKDSGIRSDEIQIDWEKYMFETPLLLELFDSFQLKNLERGIMKSDLTRPIVKYDGGI